MLDQNEARAVHAQDLAASLTNAGHKPPKTVTAALRAHELAQTTWAATPNPATRIEDAVAKLVAKAEDGTLTPHDLADLNGGMAQQLALAASADLTQRAHLKAMWILGYRLAGAVGGWLPSVITGKLRTDYLAAAAVIDSHAQTLPLTLTDSSALRGNDPTRRNAWTACLDAADVMSNCLRVISEARQMALYPHSKLDPMGAFSGAANPYALDDPRLLQNDGWGTIRSTLPDHPIHLLLEMSRRGAIWHLPTTEEQEAAAAKWYHATDTERRQLSGRAAA